MRGKRRKKLTREQVAHFNTRVACRAARFVYYTVPDFPFDQDGKVVIGPTEWLKGDENDPRVGKKRGIVKVIRDDGDTSVGEVTSAAVRKAVGCRLGRDSPR